MLTNNCCLHQGHSKNSIRKEAAWTLSNITAGNRDQIQLVVDADVFPLLYDIISSDETAVSKEALWAVSNTTSGGSPEQAMYLAQTGAIASLAKSLGNIDTRLIQVGDCCVN